MPEDPEKRERDAAHEAGHAIVGTQIYGEGFVTKIRMTRGDPRTETRLEQMGNDPRRLWQGGRLIEIREPVGLDRADALGAFCLAGMAADWVVHASYQPSPSDVRKLNQGIKPLGCGWTLIEPTPEHFEADLLSQPPYHDWFRDARDLLLAYRDALDSVSGWLRETNTLQGSEVEALMRGEKIRIGRVG